MGNTDQVRAQRAFANKMPGDLVRFLSRHSCRPQIIAESQALLKERSCLMNWS